MNVVALQCARLFTSHSMQAKASNRSRRKRLLRVEHLENRRVLATLLVDDDGGTGVYSTIQAAINDAAAGDTIEVAAGTYAAPINIQNRSDLVVRGAGVGQTIFKPTATLPWSVSIYGASRKAGIRVVNSTNIRLEDMSMDFDSVKANFVFGVLYWDSTGAIDGNEIKNLSISDGSGGYYEFGAYLRAPSYTALNRAEITVSDNSFLNTGRVGVIAHGFVDVTLGGNTFGKTFDDFGYAIELGSESIGEITNNTIFGYDAPAGDGSNSAGIFIENAFTSAVLSPLAKPVTISGNVIYDSQWALYVGNEFNGFAGNVDIQLTATGNYFHDNQDGGVVLVDEDASQGSSLTAAFQDNHLENNGGYGYFIYSWGDGNLDISILHDTITDHDVGVYLNDYASGPSTSTYNVTIRGSDLAGNSSYAVQNDYPNAAIDAQFNWWGASSGPATGTVAGNINFTHALLASAFSGENRIYTSGSVVLLVNVKSGEFRLYDGGTLAVIGGGARVQNGQLKIHSQSSSGKVDAVGSVSGLLTLTVKTGNTKPWRSYSLEYLDLSDLFDV